MDRNTIQGDASPLFQDGIEVKGTWEETGIPANHPRVVPIATRPPEVPPLNPLAILARLTENNIDPDKLGKVIDLVRDWKKDEAAAAFNAAMSRAQAKMPTVTCDAYNPQTKSNYARLENVNIHCKPIYTAEGLALMFGEAHTDLEGHRRITCEVSHEAGHSKEFYLDIPLDGVGIKGNANMTAIHGRLSAGTYAQNRLIVNIFNLTVQKDATDTDGNGPDERISEDQVKEIESYLRAYTTENRAKFFDWASKGIGSQVEFTEDLTTKFYPQAVDFLKRKAAKAGVK